MRRAGGVLALLELDHTAIQGWVVRSECVLHMLGHMQRGGSSVAHLDTM